MPLSTKIPRGATSYYGYIATNIHNFVKLTNPDYISLKALEPARGHDGQLAILSTKSAAGTLSSTGTPPACYVYMWHDTDASHENTSTILLPGKYAGILSAQFTVPATTGGTMTVTHGVDLKVGDYFYIGGPTNAGAGTGGGTFLVTAITLGATNDTLTVTNLALTGNATVGQTIAAGWLTKCAATGPVAGRWMKLSALV